jgi:hypothetical protein
VPGVDAQRVDVTENVTFPRWARFAQARTRSALFGQRVPAVSRFDRVSHFVAYRAFQQHTKNRRCLFFIEFYRKGESLFPPLAADRIRALGRTSELNYGRIWVLTPPSPPER